MKKLLKLSLLSVALVAGTLSARAQWVYRNMFPSEDMALDMTEQLDQRIRLTDSQFNSIYYYYLDWIDDVLYRMEYDGMFPMSESSYRRMIDRGFREFYETDEDFEQRARYFRRVLSSSQYRRWYSLEYGRRYDSYGVNVTVYPFGFPQLIIPVRGVVFNIDPFRNYCRIDFRPNLRPSLCYHPRYEYNRRYYGNQYVAGSYRPRNDRPSGNMGAPGNRGDGNRGNAGRPADNGNRGTASRPSDNGNRDATRINSGQSGSSGSRVGGGSGSSGSRVGGDSGSRVGNSDGSSGGSRPSGNTSSDRRNQESSGSRNTSGSSSSRSGSSGSSSSSSSRNSSGSSSSSSSRNSSGSSSSSSSSSSRQSSGSSGRGR